MQRFAVLVFVMFTGFAYAEGVEQKILAMQQAQIASMQGDQAPVGTVLMSFLDAETFRKQTGSKWVLCDGKEYPGSSWARLMGTPRIPDCRGQFFRSSGGSAAPVGQVQLQDTAPNGLVIEGEGRHAHTWGEEMNLFCGDKPLYEPYKAVHAYSDRPCFPGGAGLLTHSTGESGGHKHTLRSQNPSNETRPANITINAYIKIN